MFCQLSFVLCLFFGVSCLCLCILSVFHLLLSVISCQLAFVHWKLSLSVFSCRLSYVSIKLSAVSWSVGSCHLSVCCLKSIFCCLSLRLAVLLVVRPLTVIIAITEKGHTDAPGLAGPLGLALVHQVPIGTSVGRVAQLRGLVLFVRTVDFRGAVITDEEGVDALVVSSVEECDIPLSSRPGGRVAAEVAGHERWREKAHQGGRVSGDCVAGPDFLVVVVLVVVVVLRDGQGYSGKEGEEGAGHPGGRMLEQATGCWSWLLELATGAGY